MEQFWFGSNLIQSELPVNFTLLAQNLQKWLTSRNRRSWFGVAGKLEISVQSWWIYLKPLLNDATWYWKYVLRKSHVLRIIKRSILKFFGTGLQAWISSCVGQIYRFRAPISHIDRWLRQDPRCEKWANSSVSNTPLKVSKPRKSMISIYPTIYHPLEPYSTSDIGFESDGTSVLI